MKHLKVTISKLKQFKYKNKNGCPGSKVVVKNTPNQNSIMYKLYFLIHNTYENDLFKNV